MNGITAGSDFMAQVVVARARDRSSAVAKYWNDTGRRRPRVHTGPPTFGQDSTPLNTRRTRRRSIHPDIVTAPTANAPT